MTDLVILNEKGIQQLRLLITELCLKRKYVSEKFIFNSDKYPVKGLNPEVILKVR